MTHTEALAARLAERITNYLASGGFFNPEAMEHDKVRDLLIDCRDYLADLRSQIERVEKERDEAREAPYDKCRDLSKQGWSALSDARLFLDMAYDPSNIEEARQCIDLAQASFADTIIASEARAEKAEAALAALAQKAQDNG